jgi:hypothetical protein
MRMSVQAELDTLFAHLRLQAQLFHQMSERSFAQAPLSRRIPSNLKRVFEQCEVP